MRIYLIGYMASGKTTLGAELATALEWPFTDLDDVIIHTAGKTVSRIFEEDGENTFRLLEQQALHQSFSLPHAVIACGGGTPCWFDNMVMMNANGITVWINAPEAFIIDRLLAARAQRPLVAALTDAALRAHVSAQLQQRLPFYRQAQAHWNPLYETQEDLFQHLRQAVHK
jgi:shikimate kinase